MAYELRLTLWKVAFQTECKCEWSKQGGQELGEGEGSPSWTGQSGLLGQGGTSAVPRRAGRSRIDGEGVECTRQVQNRDKDVEARPDQDSELRIPPGEVGGYFVPTSTLHCASVQSGGEGEAGRVITYIFVVIYNLQSALTVIMLFTQYNL